MEVSVQPGEEVHKFRNASFGQLDMVFLTNGQLSFTAVGQHGKDQANFDKPLSGSGNGRAIETALTFAYASGILTRAMRGTEVVTSIRVPPPRRRPRGP